MARELGCDRGVVYAARRRLVDRGLIERRPSLTDRAERALLADPTLDAAMLAAELGCNRNRAYDARKRLRAKGAPGF